VSTDAGAAVQLGQLGDDQLDALREVGNIGAGTAATALSTMIGEPVGMSVPRVRMLPLEEVADNIGGAEKVVAAVHLRVVGDAPGHIIFVTGVETAQHLAGLLLQGMPAGERGVFGLSELECSALQELGNVLTSSYLIALTTLTGLHLEPSPPALGIDMVGALIGTVLAEVSLTTDVALLIETAFEEQDRPTAGDFLYIPTPEALTRVLHGLGMVA
jgi:chemotaxis protein CheC